MKEKIQEIISQSHRAYIGDGVYNSEVANQILSPHQH